MDETARIASLRARYGAALVDEGLRQHPTAFLDLVGWSDELDPHYTLLWLEFTYGGVYKRGVLDERTRTLVVVGQFVTLNELEELPVHIRAALDAGAKPREVLEVILQTTVYLGYSRARRAAAVFRGVMVELGRLEELLASAPPPEGQGRPRDLDRERAQWQDEYPERAAMLERYGWVRLSPGLMLQPFHHRHTVERIDRVDEDYTRRWLDCIYAGMYMRGILDERTRILCIIGELFVAGDVDQAQNHMRGVLHHGATPREVLEVILQSTIYVGMPRFIRFIAALERVLETEGRLGELRAPAAPGAPGLAA